MEKGGERHPRLKGDKEGGRRQKNGKEIVGGDREGKRETKRERETGREKNRESWGAGVRWGCGSEGGGAAPRRV